MGSYAIHISDCGIINNNLESEKEKTGGGSGGHRNSGASGKSVSYGSSVISFSITRTGQIFNQSMYACGVVLTTISAIGLVVLFLDELRRRRKMVL